MIAPRRPILPQRLALFDIDGTLIRDRGAARDAFASALRTVFDCIPPLDQYDFSGRTDPEITHMVLENSGLTAAEIDSRIGELWPRYLSELQERITRTPVEVIEGVEHLLAELEKESGITTGLLTGNVEEGARTKLASGKLNRFFGFGAFGSDSARRADLPPIAMSRAVERTGHRFEASDVVIIGDSIHDVRCGKPHSATSIAVATGKTSADNLRAEEPDFLFEDFTDAPAVLSAILGATR